ncbi:hypothetical protein M0R45_019913 [Rubus argutus]|uniref:PDZ domain-containing protein n=1 Tax=Rubus argutus TaxID=59490 RepID=A0AAW1X8G7_RUBAR
MSSNLLHCDHLYAQGMSSIGWLHLSSPVTCFVNMVVTVSVTMSVPFALVDEITNASPTMKDGLQLGDQIVKFGNIEIGDILLQKLAYQSCALPILVPSFSVFAGGFGYGCVRFENSVEFRSDIKAIMSALQQILEKAHKDDMLKNEDTIFR